MRQKLLLALLPLAIPASAVAGDAPDMRTTAKGIEPFAQCFAAAQDRASRPWWFVPKASGGGTFSDAGATGVRQPYFIEVADHGATRVIRLSAPRDDSAVVRAVDRCL